nr:ribonuclease H-like domain-containing protein [Tanacetum cinerariifolium]GEZ42927.1 ribonuclease H-like domain-containing protein [Tanacetum cinerariifolium]
MIIEQYIQMMDYDLWDVIENGLTLPKTQVVKGVTTFMPITSIEDKAQRRLDVKARSTLIMGIPNEHQLKFNSIEDAKQLMEAIKKRFGGNAATKKTQRNLLKQQYEKFTASNSEMLDQTFDRLQNFTNGAVNTTQVVNTTIRVPTAGTQVNTANIDNLSDGVICAFLASQPSSPQLGQFSRECRDLKSQDTKHKESTRRIVPVEIPASIALVSCNGFGGYDWSDQAEEGPNYALMAYTFTSSDFKCDARTSKTKPKDVRKNIDAPIIEEWVLDDEDEKMIQPKFEQKTVKPSIPKIEFVKPKQPEKKARKTVKQVEKSRQNTHRPRGNQRN